MGPCEAGDLLVPLTNPGLLGSGRISQTKFGDAFTSGEVFILGPMIAYIAGLAAAWIYLDLEMLHCNGVQCVALQT